MTNAPSWSATPPTGSRFSTRDEWWFSARFSTTPDRGDWPSSKPTMKKSCARSPWKIRRWSAGLRESKSARCSPALSGPDNRSTCRAADPASSYASRVRDRLSVDELLAEARRDLDRVKAADLVPEQRAGALVVDIRPV